MKFEDVADALNRVLNRREQGEPVFANERVAWPEQVEPITVAGISQMLEELTTTVVVPEHLKDEANQWLNEEPLVRVVSSPHVDQILIWWGRGVLAG